MSRQGRQYRSGKEMAYALIATASHLRKGMKRVRGVIWASRGYHTSNTRVSYSVRLSAHHGVCFGGAQKGKEVIVNLYQMPDFRTASDAPYREQCPTMFPELKASAPTCHNSQKWFFASLLGGIPFGHLNQAGARAKTSAVRGPFTAFEYSFSVIF